MHEIFAFYVLLGSHRGNRFTYISFQFNVSPHWLIPTNQSGHSKADEAKKIWFFFSFCSFLNSLILFFKCRHVPIALQNSIKQLNIPVPMTHAPEVYSMFDLSMQKNWKKKRKSFRICTCMYRLNPILKRNGLYCCGCSAVLNIILKNASQHHESWEHDAETKIYVIHHVDIFIYVCVCVHTWQLLKQCKHNNGHTK